MWGEKSEKYQTVFQSSNQVQHLKILLILTLENLDSENCDELFDLRKSNFI